MKSHLTSLLAFLALSSGFADKLEHTYSHAPAAIQGEWMVYGKIQNGKYKYYGFSEGSITVASNQFKVVTPGWFSASNVGNFDIVEKGSGKTALNYDDIVDLYYLKFSKAPKGSLPLGHFALGRVHEGQAFATFVSRDKNMRPVVYYLVDSEFLSALVNLSSKSDAERILEESWKVRKNQIGVRIR